MNHIFEQRHERKSPNDCTDTANNIFSVRSRARTGPDAIEHVERRGADVGVNDAFAGGVKGRLWAAKDVLDVPRA